MIRENFSIKAYNTFGIEARARYFFQFSNLEELKQGLSTFDLNGMPVFVMGTGSNLLFVKDFDGLMLHSLMDKIEVVDEDEDYVFVKSGSGVEWDDLVAWAVKQNFGGLENLSLIPGQVGATPVQNIGAYGVEVKDVLSEAEAIEIVSGHIRTFSNADCEFAYRNSIFKQALRGKYLFTNVTFKLAKKPVVNLAYGHVADVYDKYPEGGIAAMRKAIIEIRESKLPDTKILGNAGSFFKNPVMSAEDFKTIKNEYPSVPFYEVGADVKVPAAWMIDQCGLKGFREGNVGVHEHQPLVLVNYGGATGAEILALAKKVMDLVKNKFNVALEPEVNFIG